MSAKVSLAVALVAVLIVAVDRASWAGEPGAVKPTGPKPSAAKPRPKITISKETTLLTGPLRRDGYVDYVAALNEYASKGVRRENNAAVPLWQAFGPAEVFEPTRDRFFKMLGITPLPAEGKYFVPLQEYAKRKVLKPATPAWASANASKPDAGDLADKERDEAMKRPWSKEEFPVLAGWLEENEKPLQLIVEGTRRSKFYTPGIGSWVIIICTTRQPEREAARALSTRAMLRLKGGKVDEAWRDLQACHRLARLLSQGPTLIDHLMARAIDESTIHGDAALTFYGNLSSGTAKRFREDLLSLPPMAALRDKLNVGERYCYLDSVAVIAREEPGSLLMVVGLPAHDARLRAATQFISDRLVDWNEPFRMGNAWFDRLNQTLTKPTRAQRNAAIEELEFELKRMETESKDPKWIMENLLRSRSPHVAAGRHLGRMFMGFWLTNVAGHAKWDDRAAAYRSMDELLFVLAAYRAEHGGYPAELAQLCPKYLKLHFLKKRPIFTILTHLAACFFAYSTANPHIAKNSFSNALSQQGLASSCFKHGLSLASFN